MASGNKGKLTPATFYVDCPKCGEGLTEPESGSYAWTRDDLYRFHEQGLTYVCDTPGCIIAVDIPLPPKPQSAR